MYSRCRHLGLQLLATLLGLTSTMSAQKIDPTLFSELRWRFIGPDGNRVISVVAVPGEPRVYYAGAASGGIFKSTDGGTSWAPIADSLHVASIGALAVAPSDHNIVWAGTGETFIRSNVSIGDGVYKSTDAGKTWTHMGLETSGRIGRIVVDPRNPDVVFACVLGASYAPSSDRGVFRSADGGKTWHKVLFVNDSVGASDLAIDPSNPDVLLAGMWQLTIHPWDVASGGKSGGVFLSRDGGATWKKLDDGLPKETGKIAVQIARTNPDRMYALIETKDPGLYRSDDGGRHWRVINQDHDFLERPHYYTRFIVAPDDENRLYFVSVRFSQSLDGGLTKVQQPPRAGGDLHDIAIDPMDPDRMMVGDDGGVGISVNRGKSWLRVVLPNAQMYHVAVDNAVPYNVYGNRQDGYSYMGSSNSREAGRSIGQWHAVGGCESGWTIPDTVDTNVIWSGCYDAGLERYDARTRMARAVEVWPEAGYGVPPRDLKYRFQWTFPIAMSPWDHNTVYVGSQFLHKTTNGGQSWTTISPDLSTNDSTKQRGSGGLVPDNLFVESVTVLFAIAESPKERGLIWTGSMDGLVHVTRDSGAHWTNVTPRAAVKFAAISNIEPSRWDAATAYLTVDAHQMDDRAPYIYKTTDYGKTWRLLSGDLPKSPFSYVHVVREDPVRRGMLYAGTENGIWFTLDDGAHWIPLNANNLPHAPVSWITVQDTFGDLVISTYGRGFWILDDVASLRALGDSVLETKSAIFPARQAYRFRRLQNTHSAPNSMVGGDNPPYGAIVTYYVKPTAKDDSIAKAAAIVVGATAGPAAAARPTKSAAKDAATKDVAAKAGSEATRADTVVADSAEHADSTQQRPDSVQMLVLDGTGTVIRKAKGAPAKPGINRIVWDLRHAAPHPARLRTAPPKASYVRVGTSRPIVPWDLDIQPGLQGPLVAPGTYTVRLIVRGDTLTGRVVVRRDPNSAGTDDDLAVQLAESLTLRDEMNETVDMIDQLEWVRKQLVDLAFMVKERKLQAAEHQPGFGPAPGDASADSVTKQLQALEKKALAVEGKLFDVNLTGAREDAFRHPNQLFEKLASVASDIGASSGDFRATDAQAAVHAMLRQQLTDYRRQFAEFMSGDVAAFNRAIASRLGAGVMTQIP